VTSGSKTPVSGTPRISVIVAMAKNRVIGADGKIPWHLPAELAMFKRITMGHHIIMGRNTWESIGRLLPGRTAVIVTRQRDYNVAGALIAESLEAALSMCRGDDEIFVIGGGQLYVGALPVSNRIYLTEVDAEVRGDTFMPEFSLSDWRAVSVESHPADDRNQYNYKLTVYDRIVS
jgi:dihydrofolate reductase